MIMYAHEEFLNEAGLTINDLPEDLKKKTWVFNKKSRLASKPETKEKLEIEAEELADEISVWYVANMDGFDDDEEEDEEDENEGQQLGSNLTSPNDVVLTNNTQTNQNTAPVVTENQNNIVSHQQNNEIVDENQEKPKKGFGLGFLSNW